jgi:hypothetical protein
MTLKEVNPSGESPLMPILDRMGCKSMTEFAHRIGRSPDAVRGWVKGRTTPSFTIPQWKQFMAELKAAGISLDELPDDFKEKP